jgi:hypothetical protein
VLEWVLGEREGFVIHDVNLRFFFVFYLIMSVFYSGVNTGACNSSVMA